MKPLKYGAVALFADRVRAADLRFEVTAENVKPVVEICRRLDGLPLALELAAARASVLSPREICDRLDRVFDVLTEGRQASVPRHATMRAVIDWSYELLSSQARLLFDRLAIFAGGFTLETATTVCADENIPQQDVLESLSSLVAQSLVMVDFAHGSTRYHLLEATRQYALEKLAKRGERQMLAHRHALALLAVAVRLDRDWYGAPERSWFREAEAELDNFRAALGWSLGERGDLRSGCLLAGALARLWYSLSPVEGRRWVRLAIDSITEKTRADELAQLYIADAELCGALGESAASLASAEQALRLRSMLDDLQVARAEHAAGSALAAIGKGSKGEALLQKALAAAERLENRRLQALALSDLGTARSRRGDVDGARRFYAEALALYVSLGLERPAASIAGHLAEVEFAAGDPAAALHRAEEARAGHAATRNRRSEAADLSNMAAYLVALDCFDDFFNAGQSRCGIKRIYVAASRYEEFVAGIVDRAHSYRLGSPIDPETTLGPVVGTSVAETVRSQVNDAVARGAKQLIDETLFRASAPGTPYLAPQVLIDVDHSMAIMREQTFGPAVGIMKVDSDEQAVNLMNDSKFGLTAAIFSADSARAEEIGDALDTDTVFLNRCDHLDPALPRTGAENSGRGYTLPSVSFEQLTRPKSYHFRTET